VFAVAFSPDGKTLASGSEDGSVRVWDTETGMERGTLGGHAGPVEAIAYHPDGASLATAGQDRTIKLWEARTCKERVTLRGHKGAVLAVAYSPDGDILASGSEDGMVRLWNARTGEGLGILKGHAGPVRSLAFSPQGNALASGSEDRTVKLWDVAKRAVRNTLRGHNGSVTNVAFHPDGKTLASSQENGVWLWDTEMGKTLRAPAIAPIDGVSKKSFVAFSRDGKTLMVAREDNSHIELIDVKTWKVRTTIQFDSVFQLRSVACDPSRKQLAIGPGGWTSPKTGVKLWGVQSGKELATLPGLDVRGRSLAFSPDGKTLALGREGGGVELWDISWTAED
jgi:WD40 repeat protein